MPSLALLSEHISHLLQHEDSDQFPTLLVDLFKSLVPLDDASIIIFPDHAMPYCDYLESPSEGGSLHMDQFIKGSFVLDPFYLASAKGRFGFFQLDELAPPGFQTSEYYQSWFRLSGLHDECGYTIDTGDGGFVNISLGRTLNPLKFSEADLMLLNDLTPLINTLVQRRWHQQSPPERTTLQMRQRLQSALDDFGKCLLTERECQVIYLILHGHSTRAVAEKLNIAVETVKLHRRHAYAKLEVKTQAELFYLFLDSIMTVEDYQEGDILATYLTLRTGV